MRGSNWKVLLLLTALVMAGQPLAWAGNRGDSRHTATVGFDLYQDYMIVVRGAAGPMKDLRFLVDTGTTPSVLSPQVARKLHLQVAAEQIAMLGGNIPGGWATVPSLQVGPIRKESLRVLVADLGFMEKDLPVQVDGIVGIDVLGQSSFVIDYATREIRFGATPSMRLSMPLELKGGLPLVGATVNHSAVHLLLDTGSPSLILFEAMGVAAPSQKSIGDFARNSSQQVSLALGGAELGRRTVFVVPNQRDAGHSFDGVISPAALGFTRVFVDVGQGTLAFAR